MMTGKLKVYNRWAIIEVDHEVGRYYRSLFLLTYGLKLQRPSNREHITVISDRSNVNLFPLRYLDGTSFEFNVILPLYWNGNAIWLQIESNALRDLRKSIGLNDPEIDLHLCIGYLSNSKKD